MLSVPLPLASVGRPAAAGQGPILLIIDPNPLNCAILKASLAPRLGTVEWTRSLADAVNGWRWTAPEMILADVAALCSDDCMGRGRSGTQEVLAGCARDPDI